VFIGNTHVSQLLRLNIWFWFMGTIPLIAFETHETRVPEDVCLFYDMKCCRECFIDGEKWKVEMRSSSRRELVSQDLWPDVSTLGSSA